MERGAGPQELAKPHAERHGARLGGIVDPPAAVGPLNRFVHITGPFLLSVVGPRVPGLRVGDTRHLPPGLRLLSPLLL